MNLNKLQLEYLNKEHQFILLDHEGLILESSNTLVDISNHYEHSVFEIIPFFESLKNEIISIKDGEPITYSCLGIDFVGKRSVYDINFFKSEAVIVCVLADREEQYRYWLSIQQERNDISISKELIDAQAKIIKEANKQIKGSIRYAKRIQEEVLPSMSSVKKLLPDSFILFSPKDIVSGDFYWVAEEKDKVFFTPADSAGHGVPGALMSMIGNMLLNNAVSKKGIESPNEILNDVRSGIIATLKQEKKGALILDGFDAAVCVWDRKKNTMEYAGANNPLFLVRSVDSPPLIVKSSTKLIDEVYAPIGSYNNKLIYEIKPDKFSVGICRHKKCDFTNHEFQLFSRDTIYTFSDGYQDQFGGGNNKRFTSKRFKELLLSINDEEMDKQAEILTEIHEGWRGGQEQIDDICVIGVRVP